MHGRFNGIVTDGNLVEHAYVASWSVLPRRGAAVAWNAIVRCEEPNGREIDGTFPLNPAIPPDVLAASEAARKMIAAAVKMRVEAAAVAIGVERRDHVGTR
jgi:hypothetical protein